MNDFIEQNKAALLELLKLIRPKLISLLDNHGIQIMIDYCYQQIDQLNRAAKLIENTSCSNGCAFCCYDKITVSSFEASYITSFIEQFKIKVDQDIIDFQVKHGIEKVKMAQRKCSLLDDDNSCKIYEIRPMICRLYNSTDSPELFDFEKHPETTGTARVLEAWAYMLAVADIDRERNGETPYDLHKCIAKIKGLI